MTATPTRVLPIRKLYPALVLTAAAASLLVLVFWWMAATERGASEPLARAAVLAWGACLAALGGVIALRWWRGEGAAGGSPAAGRWLLALSALSVVAHFTGVDQELGGLYFDDEGIFLAQARRMNEGQVLRGWFVYPHLLFYLDAVALWLAGLFPDAVAWIARTVYGIETELQRAALVTRWVTAALGAAVVVPVFAIARRTAGMGAAARGAAARGGADTGVAADGTGEAGAAGTAAGVAAGLLAVASPIFLEISHLNLADVPGALFAALALWPVAALYDRESPGLYLAAGALSGLAAGGKYPAGTVAVAIAAAWVAWRIRAWRARARPREEGLRKPGRTFAWGLPLAAAASIAAFLATTPSLLAFPGAAGAGGADVLFGVRLYAEHGWPGVVRANNLAYYAGELARSFGLPALLLGSLGLAWGIRSETGKRAAWLLPFPLFLLALLVALRIALRRNLMPVLPVLAVLLGVGLALLGSKLRERWNRKTSAGSGTAEGSRRRAAVLGAAALAAVLALPAWTSAAQLTRAARPSTREVAAAWAAENLPPGAAIIQEAYTPELGGLEEEVGGPFFLRKPRLAVKLTLEEMRDPRYDYLFLAGEAYNRFLREDRADRPALARGRDLYLTFFDTFPPVEEWRPGTFRGGPPLHLLRLDPAEITYRKRARFPVSAGRPSAPAMAESPDRFRFTAPGQWVIYKEYLAAGSYEVRLPPAAVEAAAGGTIEIRDRSNRSLAAAVLSAGGTAAFELPEDTKAFLYLRLPPGAELAGPVVVEGVARMRFSAL